MKKNFVTLAVSIAMFVFLLACGLMGGQKATDEIEDAEGTEISADVKDDDSEECEEEEWEEEEYSKCLNDIRFADFEEKDWLDNEYIRTLRRYLDAFNRGEIEDEELEPYRKYIQGQFCIYNIQPFIGGGAFIQIVFYDHPKYLFVAWVYSDVNIEMEKVTSYHVQGISMKGRIGLTTKDVQEVLNEHPELKLW